MSRSLQAWIGSIFVLSTIGTDKRSEISPTFDIIVFGPNDRTLNPGRDLNGASRRALTLAFILALTRVSKVKAPNVIDTALHSNLRIIQAPASIQNQLQTTVVRMNEIYGKVLAILDQLDLDISNAPAKSGFLFAR